MRPWIKLFEMPVGTIDFYGEREPASFKADDIGIVTNPKAHMKIRRVLEKAPLPINLVFVNHTKQYADAENIGDPDRHFVGGHMQNAHRASGEMSEAQFKATFGIDLKRDPSALTAVFAFNEGSDRRPLTPWIIAHRLCHLVEEWNGRDGGGIVPVMIDLQKRWRDLGYDVVGVTDITWVLQDIGTTKASRDRQIVNIGEFVAECFAQYLVTGKIKLNRVTHEMESTIPTDVHRLTPKLAQMVAASPKITLPDPDAINVELQYWARSAEAAFLSALRSLQGKIVVM
jgi:hypothetical protein